MIAILLITLVPILTAADPAAAIEPSQTLYVLAAPFTTVTDTVESSALASLDPERIPDGLLIAAFDETDIDKKAFLAELSLEVDPARVVRYSPIEEAIAASVRTGKKALMQCLLILPP